MRGSLYENQNICFKGDVEISPLLKPRKKKGGRRMNENKDRMPQLRPGLFDNEKTASREKGR